MKSLAAITRERSAAKNASKLSPLQVRQLVKQIKDGWSYSAAGRHFGVSPRAARWRWLQFVKQQEGK